MDIENIDPKCGRPTKSGSPCRMHTGGEPCNRHRTEEDKKWSKLRWKAFHDGFAAGKESGRNEVLQEQRDKEREEIRKAAWRTRTPRGDQIVTVDERYAYIFDGETLAVGDKVKLPSNWFNKEASTGTVTELGSDYDGHMSRILFKMPS